jgi:membrane-associated protein
LDVVTTNLALLPGWLDPENMINAMGSWAVLGIMLVLFAECGLLVGFFLPGDTLLFIAGLLVSTGAIDINLALFIGLLWLGAFIGNMVGYWIGYKAGPAVFKRPDAKLLKPEYIERSQHFFEKYGKITILLARFVPVVRTVATVMAGAGKMNPRIYTIYSAIGGLLWVGTVTLAGYFLGQITFIRNNVDAIVVAAVVIVVAFSAVPAFLHWRQRRKARATGLPTNGAPVAVEPATSTSTAPNGATDVQEA